ncbi:MAG: hypothetical protein M0Q38_02555 [Bacteroidales bacterium]|jgi:hypothetical protein|nr:hypothetical protein [Bacteroidales bacterium]
MAQLNHEEQLQKLFANVNDWLKFAEAKNFGLLTINAAIIFGITRIDYSAALTLKIAALYVLTPFLVSSSILCIISLFPILSRIEKGNTIKDWVSNVSECIGKETVFENIHFYGYLRTIDVEEFITKFNLKTGTILGFSEYEKDLISQILYNSRITWLKYQFFKIGGLLTFIGVLISSIILPVIRFFS